MPSYLDNYSRNQWKRYAPSLRERDDITDQDWHNLECFCVNYSAFRQAQEKLNEQGLVIEFSNGNVGQNPHFKASQEAQKLMLKFGQLLGFDPVARSKIVTDGHNDDDLDAFLSTVCA